MCDASHVGNGFATQARRQELRPAASLARLWRDQNRTKKARGLPAEAIRSALTRWPALSRLLDDGRNIRESALVHFFRICLPTNAICPDRPRLCREGEEGTARCSKPPRQFATTITASTVISCFVSLTLSP